MGKNIWPWKAITSIPLYVHIASSVLFSFLANSYTIALAQY